MDSIKAYLEKTHSAVEKVYSAIDSYYELLRYPERPAFFTWSQDESEVRIEHAKWRLENQNRIEERLKKDNEFAAEVFAVTTLCATILQFAYMGIKQFSTNSAVPSDFQNIIKTNHPASKFCLGRRVDDVPIGLIVYAGRNQSHHYDEDSYREPTPTVFSRLYEWFSPTFNKSFKDDRFNLQNPRIRNYAAHILNKLGWQNPEVYEREMLELLLDKYAP